jgi:hypothetical protein
MEMSMDFGHNRPTPTQRFGHCLSTMGSREHELDPTVALRAHGAGVMVRPHTVHDVSE